MAYIVTTETTVFDAASSADISIPAGHQTNDLCLVFVSQDGGGTTISTPTGFTQVDSQAQVQGNRTTAFRRILTSSSEPDISMTGATDEWIITAQVWRGVDTTTPINTSNRTDSANSTSSSLTLAALTTTSDNCAVAWCIGFDGTPRLISSNVSTNVTTSKEVSAGNVQVCGYFNQITAGTTQTLQFLSEVASEGGNGIMIAINDANPSTPQLSPTPLQSYEVLRRYGGSTSAAPNSAAFIRHESVTWSKADGNIIPSAIGGISLLSSSTFSDVGPVSPDSTWGVLTGIRYGESAIDATGRWVGAAHALSSTNMSNRLFSIEFSVSSITGFGAQGCLIYFDDGTNWVAFQLSQSRRLAALSTYVRFIDLSNNTPYASSGTIDWSAITKVAYLYHRVGVSTANLDLRIKNALLHNKVIVVDGSPGAPASATFLNTLLGGRDSVSEGHGAYQLATKQGVGQIQAKMGVQYGNGSRPTYTGLAGTSHELPLGFDTSLKNRFWSVSSHAPDVAYKIVASASDSFNATSTIITTDTQQDFIIDATSSTSASYDFSAASIIGYDVQVNADWIINGASFEDCSIALSDGGLDGCSISEQRGAVTTSDPSKLSNNDFHSPGSGHAIEADTPGTYAFEGNSFTGYGADGSTDAAFYNNSGGAIELVIPLGDNTPTVRNGAGASTIITQPTENQKVTLTNLVVGSRIQIYDLTDDSELLNIIADATTEVWEDPDPYVADREIRVQVAYVDGDEAKQFIEVNIGTLTSTDPQVTYRVNQVDDTTYNLNAIDGSTVTDIVIDDSVMLIQVDTASITWQEIYAYEMYWLFTEEGIREIGQTIVAPDTANYIVDGDLIQIINVSGDELTITGGWGRDKTTGQGKDIFSTAGDSIFPDPPHVVAYAVGSGVTPGDVTDIASAVWDKAVSGHTATGTTGKALKDASKAKLLL